MRIGPVEYLAGAAGVGLVVAAYANRNPLDVLREALTGAGEIRPLRAGSESPVYLRPGAPNGNADSGSQAGGEWPDDPANLVKIGQGGHRLAAPAATAFRQWQGSFGRPIPITDSYRSVASQRAAYERDPSRFGAPGGSAHGEGRAVDVNLQALGIRLGPDPRTWMENALYAQLVRAAEATGWCNYQLRNGATNGKDPEPWHFSYGVCK